MEEPHKLAKHFFKLAASDIISFPHKQAHPDRKSALIALAGDYWSDQGFAIDLDAPDSVSPKAPDPGGKEAELARFLAGLKEEPTEEESEFFSQTIFKDRSRLKNIEEEIRELEADIDFKGTNDELEEPTPFTRARYVELKKKRASLRYLGDKNASVEYEAKQRKIEELNDDIIELEREKEENLTKIPAIRSRIKEMPSYGELKQRVETLKESDSINLDEESLESLEAQLAEIRSLVGELTVQKNNSKKIQIHKETISILDRETKALEALMPKKMVTDKEGRKALIDLRWTDVWPAQKSEFKENLMDYIKKWVAEEPQGVVRGKSGKQYSRLDFLKAIEDETDDGKALLRKFKEFKEKNKAVLSPKIAENFWTPFNIEFMEDPSFGEYIKKYYPTKRKELGVDSFKRKQKQLDDELKEITVLIEYGNNPAKGATIVSTLEERKAEIEATAQQNLQIKEAVAMLKAEHPEVGLQSREMSALFEEKYTELSELLRKRHPNMNIDDVLRDYSGDKKGPDLDEIELRKINGQLRIASALDNPDSRDEIMKGLRNRLPKIRKANSINEESLQKAAQEYITWIVDTTQAEVSEWIKDSLSVRVDVQDDYGGVSTQTITGPRVGSKSIRGEHIIYLIEMAKNAHLTGFMGGNKPYNQEIIGKISSLDKETVDMIQRNAFWQAALIQALENLYDSMIFDDRQDLELEGRIDGIYNAMQEKEQFYIDFWKTTKDKAKVEKIEKEEAKRDIERPADLEREQIYSLIKDRNFDATEESEFFEEYKENKKERISRGMSKDDVEKEMHIWSMRKIEEITNRQQATLEQGQREAEEKVRLRLEERMKLYNQPPVVPEETQEIPEEVVPESEQTG